MLNVICETVVHTEGANLHACVVQFNYYGELYNPLLPKDGVGESWSCK